MIRSSQTHSLKSLTRQLFYWLKEWKYRNSELISWKERCEDIFRNNAAVLENLANFQSPKSTWQTKILAMKHKFSVIENGDNGKTCCGCCFCSKTQKRVATCICLSPVVALVILILVVIIRAATLSSSLEVVPLDHSPKYMNLTDGEISNVAKRLGEVIQIRSISYNTTFQVKSNQIIFCPIPDRLYFLIAGIWGPRRFTQIPSEKLPAYVWSVVICHSSSCQQTQFTFQSRRVDHH